MQKVVGCLYIVATPIGNLEDLTFRALRILKDVDLILAEDTRQTYILLKHYDIKNNVLSYFQHSGEKRKFEILNFLLEGKNLALVVDSGTPGISDPGNELIDFLLSFIPDLKIVPIPGASAVTTALSVCGFNTSKFLFLGFLPKRGRGKLFGWLKQGKVSFCFFESPKRLLSTLEIIEDSFGAKTRIFVARELTKIHETLYRGEIAKVKKDLGERLRGEFVVVVEVK